MDPLRYYRNNLVSTLCLAEVAVERGIERFVSQLIGCGVRQGRSGCLSPRRLRPHRRAPMGETKLMCERILTDAAAASGMRVVILRYFNPVGAHPSGRIGERPLAGRSESRSCGHASGPRLCGAVGGCSATTTRRVMARPVRDFVHVTDLAEGPCGGDRRRSRRASQLHLQLGHRGGHDRIRAHRRSSQGDGASRFPMRSSGRRPGDIAASWADCSRAHVELGWRPGPRPRSDADRPLELRPALARDMGA